MDTFHGTRLLQALSNKRSSAPVVSLLLLGTAQLEQPGAGARTSMALWSHVCTHFPPDSAHAKEIWEDLGKMFW